MAGFRPLIRGFFFYTQKKHCFPHFTTGGFRPLIRGFFFYMSEKFEIIDTKFAKFPSPHSGILFLLFKYIFDNYKKESTGFRPLIRGFFFYWA